MSWKECNVIRKLNIEKFHSAFECTYNEGYVFSGEVHNFWEMVYVEAGNLTVGADERILNLNTGDIIFHKPMELHKFHIEPGFSAKLFIMSFSASGDILDYFENRALKLLDAQKCYIDDIISLIKKNCTQKPDTYDAFFESLSSLPLLSQQLACKVEFFLLSLCENKTDTPKLLDSPESLIFKKAVLIMDKRINDWISVPEIAKECNVSVSYLKNIFSKYIGFGIHKYFLKTKIITASSLLKEGKSVTEVAEILNFSSQNYFSLVFKRETGISPLNFKNTFKQ